MATNTDAKRVEARIKELNESLPNKWLKLSLYDPENDKIVVSDVPANVMVRPDIATELFESLYLHLCEAILIEQGEINPEDVERRQDA